MTRMLVTGVGGFTGQHLIARMRSRFPNVEIHGLVRSESPPLDGVAVQHACDLNDPAAVQALVYAVKPDQVVHLAGAAFVGRADVESFYRTNLLGTRNLLDALAQLDRPPSAILVASSANVYGNQRLGAISEDMTPDPVNDYGVSKVGMEYVSRLYNSRLPIIITRPFNYTGVGQSTDFLISKIVDHVRRREPEITLGNTDVARDFSDVRDVVGAYLELLHNPQAIGQVVNICSGQAYRLDDILEIIKELSNHDFAVVVDHKLVRANEIKELWGDRSRLNSLIQNQERIPLRETLNWMLKY
ncbi:GDP-mannose 4,6-dehydratase [Sphingobium sp. AN558]|uniref:GDP-mannose 4,6-dehydratase n=1 Tax=Sphingobium sp. AN558 TaxID=3133442 RepID=UPI0030C1660D